MRGAGYLAGVVLIVISVCGFAQVETVQPFLIDSPNPALMDVNCLYVAVAFRQLSDICDVSQLTGQIEKRVKDILQSSGIDVIDTALEPNSSLAELLKKRRQSGNDLRFRPGDVPELRFDIDILNIPDTRQCVFHLQTSFAKPAVFVGCPALPLKADAWQCRPVMGLVASKDLAESIIATVSSDTEAFLNTCQVTNLPGRQAADANTPARAAAKERRAAVPARTRDVESLFTASRNSEVFHKPDCPSAARIAAANRVTYKTREEAIAAGKRPCKRCNP